MTKSTIYLQISLFISILATVPSQNIVVAQTPPQQMQYHELLSLYEQGLDSIIIQQYSTPTSEAEYYYLASSYLRLGDYSQALIYFSSLINIFSSEESIWWNIEAGLAKAKMARILIASTPNPNSELETSVRFFKCRERVNVS